MRLSTRTTQLVLAFLVSFAGVFKETTALAQPVLYASDSQTNSLFTLDPADGSAALVGPFVVTQIIAGLGYDAENDILFGTSTVTDSLYSIDRSTGYASWIGNLGAELMHALEYDASTDTLFGAFGASAGDGLYTIDTSTGTATLIGNIGFFNSNHLNTVHGLAVHPDTGVLFGSVSGPAFDWGALIQIDKATGQGTLVGEFTQHIGSLAFHPDRNVLYGMDSWADELYTIDITSAQTTLIGPTGLGKAPGLAFTPEPASLVLLAAGGLLAIGRRRR